MWYIWGIRTTYYNLTMTPITKLKQSEYREGAKLTFENFQSLLNASEKVAQIENYSTASSICVLALEELSKSVILELKAINSSIPIKDLERYFTSHEPKQNVGVNIFMAIESYYESSEEDSTSKPYQLLIIGLFLLLLVFTNNGEDNGSKKSKKSYFDLIKESGFYVGYDEISRQWISPSSNNDKESFDRLFEYISEFSEKVKNWIFNGKINKVNILEFIDKLDDNFIDKSQLNKLKIKTEGNNKNDLKSGFGA